MRIGLQLTQNPDKYQFLLEKIKSQITNCDEVQFIQILDDDHLKYTYFKFGYFSMLSIEGIIFFTPEQKSQMGSLWCCRGGEKSVSRFNQ